MLNELLEKFEDVFKPASKEEVEKRPGGIITKIKKGVKKYGGAVINWGPAKISDPQHNYFYAIVDFGRIFDYKNEDDMNFIKKVIVDGLGAEKDPDNIGYYWVGISPTDYPVWLYVKGLGNIDKLEAKII